MADTIAAWRSASVATATRAANVDALSSWSAWRVSTTSRTRATSGDGARPSTRLRKYAACESDVGALTGALPLRIRCQAATVSGTSAVRRTAFRKLASGSLARVSGSKVAARDTAVRSASRG